jgi:hypothetical protein
MSCKKKNNLLSDFVTTTTLIKNYSNRREKISFVRKKVLFFEKKKIQRHGDLLAHGGREAVPASSHRPAKTSSGPSLCQPAQNSS